MPPVPLLLQMNQPRAEDFETGVAVVPRPEVHTVQTVVATIIMVSFSFPDSRLS